MKTLGPFTLFQGLAGLCHGASILSASDRMTSVSDPIILKPISGASGVPSSLMNDLHAREDEPSKPVVLRPMTHKQGFASSLANSLQSRQLVTGPAHSVLLGYGASNIEALVEATMKQDAIVLEDLEGIRSVSCGYGNMEFSFKDAESLKSIKSEWPASDFIFITYSPEGGCNTPEDRGFHIVSAVEFDDVKLTASATCTKADLADLMEEAIVVFDSAASPVKRDIKAAFNLDFQGTVVDTSNLKIALDQVHVESDFRLKGQFGFNFLKFKPSKATLDIEYVGATNLNVSASVKADVKTSLYKYSPLSASISAFSIPGILDVGPIASLTAGVEFAASGNVDATLAVQSKITGGNLHLDLLDSASSSSSGWTPITTVSSHVSAEVSLQLNPYADLNLALGVKVFKGAIDLTAGFGVKPEIINAFSADLDFGYTSESGVSFSRPEGHTCQNGAWFASTFNMDVNAYVGPLFSKTIFNVNAPIYKSQCWTWVE